MALLMLLFQTIPGIIIYRKYKREVELKPWVNSIINNWTMLFIQEFGSQ
jgi:hypothetical protein